MRKIKHMQIGLYLACIELKFMHDPVSSEPPMGTLLPSVENQCFSHPNYSSCLVAPRRSHNLLFFANTFPVTRPGADHLVASVHVTHVSFAEEIPFLL